MTDVCDVFQYILNFENRKMLATEGDLLSVSVVYARRELSRKVSCES